jgi:hypothetical protein
MKRLDQGHLHPKLKVPGLTCPSREPNPDLRGGRRNSGKEPFKQLVLQLFGTSDYEHTRKVDARDRTLIMCAC